jgi:hypothetical protein
LVTTRRPPPGAITTQAGPEFVKNNVPAGASSGDHTQHAGGPSRNSFREPAGYQDVWCVTTTLGTWTAKQEGHVFLTGNSGCGKGGAITEPVIGRHPA